MITSVKVKFRASRVSGKAGTIYYQLTHLRRTRCITTGIRLMPGEWDASAQRAVSPEPGRVPVWQCRIECDVDRLHRIIRRPGPRGAALYGRRGCRPLLRTVLRRGRDGVHARADRAADSRQPAGHGPQLHAHAPQFFGLSRRRRTAFRRVHRAAGRGVQRLPAAPRGRPEHRVVLHAHPALGLQQGGPQAAGPSRRRRSAVSIRASTARANGPSTSGSSPV